MNISPLFHLSLSVYHFWVTCLIAALKRLLKAIQWILLYLCHSHPVDDICFPWKTVNNANKRTRCGLPPNVSRLSCQGHVSKLLSSYYLKLKTIVHKTHQIHPCIFNTCLIQFRIMRSAEAYPSYRTGSPVHHMVNTDMQAHTHS